MRIGVREEKAKPDARVFIFTRELRGWCGSIMDLKGGRVFIGRRIVMVWKWQWGVRMMLTPFSGLRDMECRRRNQLHLEGCGWG